MKFLTSQTIWMILFFFNFINICSLIVQLKWLTELIGSKPLKKLRNIWIYWNKGRNWKNRKWKEIMKKIMDLEKEINLMKNKMMKKMDLLWLVESVNWGWVWEDWRWVMLMLINQINLRLLRYLQKEFNKKRLITITYIKIWEIKKMKKLITNYYHHHFHHIHCNLIKMIRKNSKINLSNINKKWYIHIYSRNQ